MNYRKLNERIERLERKCCCSESGNSSCCFEEITLEEAQSLVAGNLVVPNTLYKITGVHKNKDAERIQVLYDDGTNSGITIYLTGLSTNEFSTEGWGEFYNPKYDQATYGEDDGYGAIVVNPGSGYVDGTDVPVTGGSGSGMTVDITTDSGFVTAIVVSNPGTGYEREDGVTIDSGNQDATFFVTKGVNLYNIWDGDEVNGYYLPTYTVGRKKIWGPYVWTNANGNVGAASSAFQLNSEWVKVSYNETDYNKVIDYIEYDFTNDWLCRRRQAEPVIDVIYPFQFWNDENRAPAEVTHHGISAMQWGNKYNKNTGLGVGLMNINDSYCELINFKGAFALGISMNNYSWMDNTRIANFAFLDGLTLNNYSYIKSGYIEFSSYVKGLVLDNYSYIDTQKLTGGSFFKNIKIDNNCWIEQWDMRNESSTQEISILNNSYLQSAEGSYLNGSIIKEVSLANGCYITGFQMDNATMSEVSLINSSYFAGSLMNCSFDNCYFNSFQTSIVYSNQNLTRSTFQNGLSFGFTSSTLSTPGVTYRIHFNNEHAIINLHIDFDGSSGRGQVGSLTIPGIGFPIGYYIERVIARTNGLVAGGGSAITLGIDTDAPDSGLDSSEGLVTNLNGGNAVIYDSLGFEVSTTTRNLVMGVETNDVTAGTLYLTIEMRLAPQ